MSLLDVLSGKVPLMKPAPNSASSSKSIGEMLVGKFDTTLTPAVDPLVGSYDMQAASRDYQLAKRGSGDLQSMRPIIIDATVTGPAQSGRRCSDRA